MICEFDHNGECLICDCWPSQCPNKTNMTALNTLISRLEKIGIKIELIGNYPWIYLDKVNGNSVKETFEGNHGFTIAFLPVRSDRALRFTDIDYIFEIIRKYR